MTDAAKPVRMAIVGTGNVGATLAYALLWSGLAAEIVLIDANRARAEGEAMDLNHAMPFTRPVRIWAAAGEDPYAECAGAAIVALCAGAGQKPGETRLDLVKRNAGIFREVVPRIAQHNPAGILLIATNPVDVLTYVAWKWSGLPAQRVIGSGTVLDTARFRYLLSRHFGVDPRSVHAHIIGEHGDSEVPVWSLANVAGMRLRDYCAASGKPYEIDHLCYRVANLDRYETKKTELAQLGYLLSEAQVNGRPIATYKLKKPLEWSHGKYISLVELPAPKPGKNYSEGLEHFDGLLIQKLLVRARHVEDLAPILEDQPCAATAHDRRGVPVPRHAPAVQHEIPLVGHPPIVANRAMPGDPGCVTACGLPGPGAG